MRIRGILLASSIVLAVQVFAAKDPSEYPLRVMIIETHWSQANFGTSGYGHGNLKEDDALQGFDYTFECSAPFNATQGPNTYMGRWKKQDTRLAILTVEIGNTSKQRECELKTTLVNVIYSIKDGHLFTYTRQEFEKGMATQRELKADMTPPDKDLTHFSLHVVLLDAQWEKSLGGGVIGTGRGNVHDGDSVVAFDFSALCPGPLDVGPVGRPYLGKWAQENTKLVVLTHSPGEDASKLHQCELKTDVQASRVYLKNRSTGVTRALTQAEYKEYLEKKKTRQSTNASASAPPELGPVSKNKLTNADVISMAGSGLSPEIILAKMSASECAFDTSIDGLKQLKGAKVPDAVVIEMIKKSAH